MRKATVRKTPCKVNITVYKDGVPIGFVKSISYTNGKFNMTYNKANAKGYKSEDEVQYDIDFLAKFYCHKGYVFLYD